MQRTRWIAPAALVLAGSGLVTVPSQGATVTVNVAGSSFQGGPRTVAQGTTVSWTFNDGGLQHTTTSDRAGFWSSPVRTSGQFSATFPSAGTFTYHCQIHLHMTSAIIVPIRSSKVTGGKRVQWASALEPDRSFDIRVKKPGSTRWVVFRSATTKLAKSFTPSKHGRYLFKARTRIVSTGVVSAWSPKRTVRVG